MNHLAQLHPGLRRWVVEQNWKQLTEIQKAVLEPALAGRDCVIEAPTAGGKTEAVLFPTLTNAAKSAVDSVQILYLAPLKALLNDLEARAQAYAERCGLQAFRWHGDVTQTAKLRQFREPPNLLLTTPESLEAILLRRAGWRKFFTNLEAVIIDEAHSFAAGDRGGHLLTLLERLNEGMDRKPQRLALTATIGNPDEMCRWLSGTDTPALRISASPRSSVRTDFHIRHFTDGALSAEEQRLLGLIGEIENRRTLTFVRSRSQAEETAKNIGVRTGDSVRISTHHSSVSRFFREEAERLIAERSEHGLNTILSTSTLELGIDIGELDAVIQLDALASPGAFLQRVGRTGRRPGTSRCFRGLTVDLEALLLLTATVSLGLDSRSEHLKFSTRAFHLLAHQILCVILQKQGARAGEIWQILNSAQCFSGILEDEFLLLLRHMLQEEYLRTDGSLLLPGDAAEQRYLRSNWRNLFAVFSSAPMYQVNEGRTHVGTLDVLFVSDLELPFHFTLAGRRWQATRINHDSKTIQAKKAGAGPAPKWESYGGPAVPFETAQRVGKLLHGHMALPDVLHADAGRILSSRIAGAGGDQYWKPGMIRLDLPARSEVSILTFAGDRINRTLAVLLESCGLDVSSTYSGLTIKSGANEIESVLNTATELFDLIRRPGSAPELNERLLAQQPSWRFSPFSPMLPDMLNRAAIIDDQLDLGRLQRLVTRSVIRHPGGMDYAPPS